MSGPLMAQTFVSETSLSLCSYLYTFSRFQAYVNLMSGSASNVFSKRIPSIVILRYILRRVSGMTEGVN